jgi:hypothetical protein
MLVVFKNDAAAKTKSLPGKEDGLIAALTNSAVCCFDNIDGARLEDPQRSTISDTICHLSTGAEVPWRKLFSDMEVLDFKIQNHGFFTARVDPFSSRIDVHRRTITLTMEPPVIPGEVPEGKEGPTKDHYTAWTHEARPRILAEILLRCQNMVRAHQQYGTKQYRSRTEMADYEIFTYRCAEYEGTLPETQALWEVSRKLYLEAITDHNFLVLALRTWLGKTGVPNPNREARHKLCSESLRACFRRRRASHTGIPPSLANTSGLTCPLCGFSVSRKCQLVVVIITFSGPLSRNWSVASRHTETSMPWICSGSLQCSAHRVGTGTWTSPTIEPIAIPIKAASR